MAKRVTAKEKTKVEGTLFDAAARNSPPPDKAVRVSKPSPAPPGGNGREVTAGAVERTASPAPKRGRKRTNGSTNGANLGFEARLWEAADKLRNNMDAAEYKHVVLGLISLKYISDALQERREALKGDPHTDPEDRDEITPQPTSFGCRRRPAGFTKTPNAMKSADRKRRSKLST